MSNHGRRIIVYILLKFRAPPPHGIHLYGILLLLLLLLQLSAATPRATALPDGGNSSQYPYAIDANFDPSMMVIVVIITCAFFFIGFFSVYIRHCADDGAAGGILPSAAAAGGRSRLLARGLNPSVIESFPVFVYSAVKDLKIGKGALECVVCIAEFKDDENLRLLPKCNHVFHPDCIDAWLASHSTCPVCRADLKASQLAGHTKQRDESIESPENQDFRFELVGIQNQVAINVEEDRTRNPQAVEIVIPKQSQRGTERFPRSHSTGHSLVQLGEICERYTLTLPEEVRKQIVTRRLERTTSCTVVLPREGSSRRGYRSGGEGSSRGRSYQDRSDQWVLTMTPPFFAKTGPASWPKVGVDGEVTVVGTSKMFLTSVKTPFDCLAGKSDGSQSSTRAPI